MDVRDRAVGALVGLAVGDAVGTTLEFCPPGTFDPIDDLVGGGPFGLAAGQWTDDTSMALCLAESVLDTGGLDLADQLRRYVLWWHNGHLSSTGRCFDIGVTTRAQLSRFERTGQPVDPHPNEDAAANGSLMRLAPVPIRWHADVGEAAARSGESSRTTHPARRPVDACRLLGAMVAALIGGRPFEEVIGPGFWEWGDLHPAVRAIAEGSWRAKAPPAIRGTGYCIDALEAAVWAVAGADDFRSAVLRAANLGDDADTTAAIAGQLAGARFGVGAIPEGWRRKLTLHDRICSLAHHLWLAGSGAPPPATWPFDATVHAWWVQPGRLLAGEYPGHPKSERASEKLNVLLDAGVRTFIDLTTPADRLEPYEPVLREIAARRGLVVEHVPFPVPDLGAPDAAACDALLARITEAQGRGGVYVHCWGGVGRTATVVGCLLIAEGMTDDEALERIASLRQGTRKAHRPAPETQAQRDLLRRRARARRAGDL